MSMQADPAGMRRVAAELRGRADRLAAVMQRLDTQVSAMGFQGPAASRFRATMAQQHTTMEQIRGILLTASEAMNRGAAGAEANMTNQTGRSGP